MRAFTTSRIPPARSVSTPATSPGLVGREEWKSTASIRGDLFLSTLWAWCCLSPAEQDEAVRAEVRKAGEGKALVLRLAHGRSMW